MSSVLLSTPCPTCGELMANVDAVRETCARCGQSYLHHAGHLIPVDTPANSSASAHPAERGQ
jgi:hypothetical protein